MGDSNAVSLYVSKETTWNEVPTQGVPVMTQMRFTSESFGYNKSQVASETIRDDGMRDEIAEVGATSGGNLNVELSHSSYDLLWEALFGADFSAETVTDTTISASNTTSSIDDSGSGLANFVVGQFIRVSGFAGGNEDANGIYRVTSVAAGSLGVSPAPPTDRAAGDNVTVAGNYLRTTTARQSLLIEKRYTDMAPPQYEHFRGQRVGGCEISLTAQEVITASFSTGGANASGPSGTSIADTGNDVAAATTPVLTASAHVGSIERNGVAYPVPILSATININRNTRNDNQVGGKFPGAIGYGFWDVTGTITAYFQDPAIYQDVINHADVSFRLRMTDADGNVMVFTIPKVKVAGSPQVGGGNQPMTIPLNFEAIRDPATNTAFQLDVLDV